MDKAGLRGDNLCQGKNDYKSGGIFYGLFLAPKLNYCLIVDKFGLSQEHRIFKGFIDSKRLLDRCQCFKMVDGENILAILPRSWKNRLIAELLYQLK